MTWLFPVFNALGLMAMGAVALRRCRESGYAVGMVIAFSLAFLLNGTCAVALIR